VIIDKEKMKQRRREARKLRRTKRKHGPIEQYEHKTQEDLDREDGEWFDGWFEMQMD
jgi:hypothetical protein